MQKKKTTKKEIKFEIRKPKGIFGNVFFYVFLAFIGYSVLGGFFQSQFDKDERPISEVIKLINQSKVQDIMVSGDNVDVVLRDGTKFSSRKEQAVSFDQILSNNNVDRSKVVGKISVEQRITFDQIISPILMFGLPLILIILIFRQMKGTSGEIFSFGKSRARLFNKDNIKVTFGDVAGSNEAKTELMEIVDFLKNSEKYRKLGARIPKGILLVGPSGVGKTLLAKAVAGEAGVPFYSVAGSEFMEMLVGVGSARARDLFKVAKESQPSLIFIDEIDAIGRQRGMGIGGGHDEREQTLNQILIEMDGFDTRTNVIVIAATNRPDMLDPALIRPGRFDRKITISLPDLTDRQEIIKIHLRGKPYSQDISLEKLAKRTVGFSGADLENMLNEGAILAARENRSEITELDLEEAALKVTIGSERKTLQTDEEKNMTAYHEAGHALVSLNMPDMDPVHRISIVARGGSLGHTSFPPERDRYNETQSRLKSFIATMLGGRAAEEIVFNELTIGASNDIEKATDVARKMVTEYGMSALGPVSFDGDRGNYWLAKELTEAPMYSQEIAAKIDSEIRRIIDEAYAKAKQVLLEKRNFLDLTAKALMEKETITGDEFLAITNA